MSQLGHYASSLLTHRESYVIVRYLTRLAIYTYKPAAPGEKKKRYYRLVVKRKFLGREINVTGQWSWILES